MIIEQTIEVPASRRITLEVPPQIPVGPVILTFTPAHVSMPKKDPSTVEEALQLLSEQAADPSRKPISRLFGKHKGIFGGNGEAYQKVIRNEWD